MGDHTVWMAGAFGLRRCEERASVRLSMKRAGLVLFIRGISHTWEVLHNSMQMMLRGQQGRCEDVLSML